LFYVAPAQDAYMCRLRVPGGHLNSLQLYGISGLADTFAGGYFFIYGDAKRMVRDSDLAWHPITQEPGSTSVEDAARYVQCLTAESRCRKDWS